MRKFVCRKAFVVTRRARQRGRFREKFRGPGMITKFVAIKPGKRFIELRFVRIIFDSAFEEIFSDCGGSMLERERALGRKFHHAKREQHSENERDASHKREHTSPRSEGRPSPLVKGGKTEVRGSMSAVATSINPHPARSLGKGEAKIVSTTPDHNSLP